MIVKDMRKKLKGKILYFDIETSLIETYTHHLGQQYMGQHQIKKDKSIICIAYKVEGWKSTKVLRWNNGDDTELLREFSEIIKSYPVCVGQNGDAFDIKVLKGRLWALQLPPIKNLQSLDTLKMSRQTFKLTSHTLDYKLRTMGLGGKIPTSFGLWVRVQEGDKAALEEMCRYCKGDVEGLQETFWSILPYVDKVPVPLGMVIQENREACPMCGEVDKNKNGVRYTSAGPKQRWNCRSCGHCWDDTRLKATTDKLER